MKFLMYAFISIALAGAVYYFFMSPHNSISARTTPIKIVAFGDSLTKGYGLEEEDAYPSQLVSALSPYQIDMVNLGVNGDTSADARRRVQEVVDEHPDIVLVGIGGNDALRLLPVEDTKANIEAIIQKLKAIPNPPRIVLLEMQASIHGGLAYKRSFDGIYEDIANKYDITLVPFILTSVYLDQKYMLEDRIHMNREGYAFIVGKYLKDAVEDEINKLK